MQRGWLLMWLIIAYSCDRLSCRSEELSCVQVIQPRSQCDVLNISSRTNQPLPHLPMDFDILMLQIDRASMLYPDGEITRMLSRAAKSVQYKTYNNQILRIPADCRLKEIRLKSAPRLQTIKVSGTNNALNTLQVIKSALRRIPTSLQRLQRLHVLYVTHGILDTFSLEPLQGIHSLTHVFLMQNNLRRLEVSKNPTMFIAIENLSMSENQLQIIDLEFFKPLKRLRELRLQNNQLKQIVAMTPVILPSLNVINLAYNELTQLNFSNWIAPKLTVCILTGNNFTELPLETARFANLSVLSFAFNQLTILDLQKLKNLPKLTNVDVANNRLHTVLPDCQSPKHAPCQRVSLAALQVLELQNNYLTNIDFNHWDLPSLRTIKLQNNQLQRLGNPFNKLPKLEFVHITNNALSCSQLRSLETYFLKNMILIDTKADNSTCPTNSSIKHPRNEAICCND